MVGGGVVAKLCPTLTTPQTVARQAPLFMNICLLFKKSFAFYKK